MSEEIKSELPEQEGFASEGQADSDPSARVTEAMREGASDAAKAANRILPAAGEYLSRGVYGACYYATYGVVFSALTLAKIVPGSSAVSRGVHDGASDARKAVQEPAEHAPAVDVQPEGAA